MTAIGNRVHGISVAAISSRHRICLQMFVCQGLSGVTQVASLEETALAVREVGILPGSTGAEQET